MTAAGYEPVLDPDEADIVIFNTCCVRQNADDRAHGRIGSLKERKKLKPGLIIAVGGCLAQLEGEILINMFPHVDIVFGTHNISRLPSLVGEIRQGRRAACEISDASPDFAGDLPALRRHEWHSWLPITVGCDNFCSYCVVPYVRGREKSRPIEHLIKEAGRLAADGVREVTLLGQNVNSYGRDLYGRPAFTSLLDRLSRESGLDRIRFTTSHPKDLELETIDLIAVRENLCPHFHLPLQSGSDRVLKKMRRKYTADRYLELVRTIKKRVPDVAVTTDIMVGFPGETENDFEKTLEVVREAAFDQAFMFVYSPRPGTAASGYDDPVTKKQKSARFDRLVETQNEISLNQNRELVGRKFDVFVEGLSKKKAHRLAARTASNKLVHLNGADNLIGQDVSVLVNAAFSWFLIGEGVSVK